MMEITRINKSCIYVPKKFLLRLGLREGDKVIIKCSNEGLMVVKPNIFQDVDDVLNTLDEGLRTLFVKEKQKELRHE